MPKATRSNRGTAGLRPNPAAPSTTPKPPNAPGGGAAFGDLAMSLPGGAMPDAYGEGGPMQPGLAPDPMLPGLGDVQPPGAPPGAAGPPPTTPLFGQAVGPAPWWKPPPPARPAKRQKAPGGPMPDAAGISGPGPEAGRAGVDLGPDKGDRVSI